MPHQAITYFSSVTGPLSVIEKTKSTGPSLVFVELELGAYSRMYTNE